MGGVSDFLFGGDSSATTYDSYKPITAGEKNRMADIENKLNELYQQNPDTMQDMFRQHLTQFVNTDPYSKDSVNKATSYVDQLFTNPAQQAVNQQVADYSAQASANAAAMGRSPNLDQSTQAAIAGEAMRQNLGLKQQRGQMIGQQVGNQYNTGLQNLDTLMSGSNFLNNLTQQAFANRLNLLNARSGVGNFYQRERGQGAVGQQTSPGLLGTVSGAAGQVAGTVGNIGKAVAGIGNLF